MCGIREPWIARYAHPLFSSVLVELIRERTARRKELSPFAVLQLAEKPTRFEHALHGLRPSNLDRLDGRLRIVFADHLELARSGP